MPDHPCNSQILIIFWTYVNDLCCSVRPPLVYWKVRQVWTLLFGPWENSHTSSISPELWRSKLAPKWIHGASLFCNHMLHFQQKYHSCRYFFGINFFVAFVPFCDLKSVHRSFWVQGTQGWNLAPKLAPEGPNSGEIEEVMWINKSNYDQSITFKVDIKT